MATIAEGWAGTGGGLLLGDQQRKLEEMTQVLYNAYLEGPFILPPEQLISQLKEQGPDLLYDLVQQLQWETLGTFGYAQDLTAERTRAIDESRRLWKYNPLAQWMIWLHTNYGFGENIVVVPEDEDAIKVWDEFWKADRNQSVLAQDKIADKLSNWLLVDGNRFLAFYGSILDGETTIRRINTKEIVEIVTDPADNSVPLFYKRQWTTSDNKPRTMYYPDWEAFFQGDLDRARLPRSAVRADQIQQWEDGRGKNTIGCVLHIAFNGKDEDSLYGWPLLAAGSPWIRAQKRHLENRLAVSASKAMYARKAKVSGGSRAVSAVISNIQSALSSTQGYETNPPAVPGSTLVENQAVDTTDLPMTTGASDAKTDGEMFSWMAGLSGGVFPHYMGLGDAYRLATATSMEAPIQRQFSRYQVFWGAQFRKMVRIVLQMKEEYGGATYQTYEAEVSTDRLVEVDLDGMSQALGRVFQTVINPMAEQKLIPQEVTQGMLQATLRTVLQALGVDAETVLGDEKWEVEEEEEIEEGGKGSGWFAPPKGTHGTGKVAGKTVEEIAARDLGIALNGTTEEIKAMLKSLGWSDEKLNSLNERQLKMLATKRQPAPAEDWLQDQKGKFVTLYHGTARPMENIRQEGLKAQPSTFANVGQEAGVFGVADYNKRWAEYWGNKSQETYGGEITIIEMKIPRADVKIDPGNPRSFLYTAKDVPPENIVKVTKLSPVKGGTADFKFHEDVPDPQGSNVPYKVSVNDVFTGKAKEGMKELALEESIALALQNYRSGAIDADDLVAFLLPARLEEGGPGSGHYGHAGRPGKIGGSLPRSQAMSIKKGRDWQARQEAAKRAAKKGKAAIGHDTTAFGNDPNKTYSLRSRVVSLDDMIPSNTDGGAVNPDYDPILQPRDRSRAASQLQIDNLAKNMNSEAMLTDFHQLDKGTPIIGDDMMVESGNGRTLALRRAREMYPEEWKEYQGTLKEHLAENGIDPDEIQNIKDPILVRERITEVDRDEFAREANSPSVLQMSPLEQARSDRRHITPESLNRFVVKEDQSIDQALRAAANRPFVQNFVGSLTPNERATLMRADGSLNRMGIWRAKAAMFSQVFPDEAGDRLGETFFESVDPGIKNFENAMADSLPQIARAESLIATGQRQSDLSLAVDIAKAIDMHARLKETGLPAQKYIAQASMFERELTSRQERLLIGFDKASRSRKSIREILGRYADGVISSPDPRQQALFDTAPLTADDLVGRMIE